MKGERKYYALLMLLAVVVVAVQLFSPRPLDWTPNYLPNNKDPYGAYVTDSLFVSFFGPRKVRHHALTFYEMADSLRPGDNLLSFSDEFSADRESVRVLLQRVSEGSTAFLSAQRFFGLLSDTLRLYTSDVFFSGYASLLKNQGDTTDLKFITSNTQKRGYYYQLENVSYFFSPDSLLRPAFIMATNAWNKPVTLRIPWGQGSLILNSTPLAFTNNYLLVGRNHEFASQSLSRLPRTTTWWTSYYQFGRMENPSPLRYILSQEPLRWAYYLTMTGLLLFILIEAKRKQRMIPILRPPGNTSLEFVRTISQMYWVAKDHRAIALKKIAYFLDQVRSRYHLPREISDDFLRQLTRKSGVDRESVVRLFALIESIQYAAQISEDTLHQLTNEIHKFKNR